MGKLHKKWIRNISDPGGALIHKLTNKTWDRGADNARAAIAPWESNTPPPAPPPTAPLPDEEDLQRAKRRSVGRQGRRGGRSSTILSGGESSYLGP